MAIAVFLAIFAAAQAEPAPSTPITVTGHQWAPFISPMGEPFRARTPNDDTLADWFRQADRNHDGALTADEMVADAERFFATLDTNHDGQVDPDELAHYEYEVAPEIQVMSRTKRAPGTRPRPVERGGGILGDDDAPVDRRQRRQREAEIDSSLAMGGALQGAGRYALLDMPEPVAAADADFNRAITLQEFRDAARARFRLLDRANQGRISLAQLESLRPELPADGRRRKRDPETRDSRIGNPLPPHP
jgi:Ca2+-binding EF-hand superfamily protein